MADQEPDQILTVEHGRAVFKPARPSAAQEPEPDPEVSRAPAAPPRPRPAYLDRRSTFDPEAGERRVRYAAHEYDKQIRDLQMEQFTTGEDRSQLINDAIREKLGAENGPIRDRLGQLVTPFQHGADGAALRDADAERRAADDMRPPPDVPPAIADDGQHPKVTVDLTRYAVAAADHGIPYSQVRVLGQAVAEARLAVLQGVAPADEAALEELWGPRTSERGQQQRQWALAGYDVLRSLTPTGQDRDDLAALWEARPPNFLQAMATLGSSLNRRR